LSEYQEFLGQNQSDISAFKAVRELAFETELADWHRNGQFNYEVEEQVSTETEADWPEDAVVIDSPVSGSVWQIEVKVGQHIKAGQTLMILESMKMEIPVFATSEGVVSQVLLDSGQRVNAGQALVVLEETKETL
jgi:urea carboxylase